MLQTLSHHLILSKLTLLFCLFASMAIPLNAGAAEKPTYAKKMQLGQLLYFNGNVDHAIRAFKYAASLKPDAFEPHLNLVNIYVQKQDMPEAIDECREVLKLKPNHRDIHLILANLLRNQAGSETNKEEQTKLLDQAAKEAEQAGELGADEALIHNTLGILAVQKGEHDKALEHINKAIDKNYKLPDAHLIKGVLTFKKGDKEGALKEIDIAIKQKGKHAEARNTKADILTSMNKHTEAMEEYKKATEDDPNFHQALSGIANILIQQQKYEEALEKLEKAHSIRPNDKNINYSIAVCHEKMGQIDKAIPYFNEGLMSETDATMAAQIRMHVQQLQNGHMFNLPGIGTTTSGGVGPGSGLNNNNYGDSFFGESFKDLIKIKPANNGKEEKQ